MKKRAAIWMFGGIGTGNFSQGQPVLEKLVRELSLEFEIVVYSRSLINPDYVPIGFLLKCAPKNIKNEILRWLLLIKYFLFDHFQKRFSLVCAFWGFPGGFLASLIAKVFFLPCVVNLQGGDSTGIAFLNYGIMHRRVFRRLALWTYQRATILTTLTNFQKNLLTRYGVSRPIRVIPLGADPRIFTPFVREMTPEGSWNLLHVSNYSPIKDTETLLNTFAMICRKKEARLRIVGGDYPESEMEVLCRNLGIEQKVNFHGVAPYDTMPEHYAWADMLIHTSIYEGQGIVIAEAALAGVLVAGTSVGLISDLGDSGAVAGAIGNSQELAKKVLEIMDNAALREDKKKNALAWANQHDFFWTVDQFKKMFHELS